MQSRIAGIGIASLLVLFALVLLLIERAPPIVAALMLLFMALGANLMTARDRIVSGPVFWLVGVFLIWLLLSASWSIAGGEAVGNSWRIAAMIATAAFLPVLCLAQTPDVQSKGGRWATIASCLTISLLLFETVFDMPLLRTTRFLFNSEVFTDTAPEVAAQIEGVAYYPKVYLSNRLTHLASVVAILTLPVVGYFWIRGMRLAALATGLASALALILSPSQTPLTALTIGAAIGAFLLVPRLSASRSSHFTLAGVLSIGVLASPWIAQSAFAFLQEFLVSPDPSVIHRFAIWDHVAGLIAERPVIGSGIEAARALGRQGVDLGELVAGHTLVFQAIPLHPHNASLQIWLELGGVGALIFALLLFFITKIVCSYASQSVVRACLVGCWIAGLAIAHLSYGIWQYWWVASLGVLFAMVVMMFASERTA